MDFDGSESVAFPNTSIAHGFKTTYSYDTLNNLTTVNQGSQQRDFTYSSLSRLLSATNPESGTINYAYDNNGNLLTKTDARGDRTSYVYDALNRVVQRNYSTPNGTPGTGVLSHYEPTPGVTYFYDGSNVAGGIANSKGKLTKVVSSVSTTEYTSFDILGRVTGHKQTTDGVEYGGGTDLTKWMTYTYNLSGALIEQTYPSGRKVKSTLDAVGNLAQVQSQKSSSDIWRPYASNFVYTAAGAVSAMRLGNGLWERTEFNSRLQPTMIGLGTGSAVQNRLRLDYAYGEMQSNGTIDTTKNNGNLARQTITVPTVGSNAGFAAVQNYQYDSLNRLKQATEMITPHGGSQSQSWRQTFTFDRYGNRNFDEVNTTTIPKNCGTPPNQTVCPADVPIYNPSVNTANNRLNGYTFDAAGNTIQDAEGRSFIYDGENKQVEVKNSQNQVIGKYYFDGDGKRVKKVVPAGVNGGTGETTVFVYDASGRLVAEYSTVVESPQNAKTSYLTVDHLGSSRILTDQNGAVISRRDFMPFGEEITSDTGGRTTAQGYVGVDSIRKKFTTYERDNEISLDFAQARMHDFNLGRFSSPDPLMSSARRLLPQSWNRYSYVLNNPLKYVDPSGLEWYQRTVGNRTDYCFKNKSNPCSGFKTKYDGHVLENPSVNGQELGYAVVLTPEGAWSE